jgi:hypothetical protein
MGLRMWSDVSRKGKVLMYPCGNKKCVLCPPQSLASMPAEMFTRLQPEKPRKTKPRKKVYSNRGMIPNIIGDDLDGASASWGINIALHEGN